MRAKFILASTVFAMIIIGEALSGTAWGDELEWTSPDGQSIKGEFLRMEGKDIWIRRNTGSEVKIPLSSLSLESHLQALKLAKPDAFSKELVKAPEIVQPVEIPTTIPVASITVTPFGEDPTIDQFLRIAINEWERGNNFVVWHMLPPRMQQDIEALIAQNMQAIGPAGPSQIRTAISLLASLASKKRDWVVQSDLVALYPIQSVEEGSEQWPVMVGMLQKLSDNSLWAPENFQPGKIVPWLASLSELLSYFREMNSELNQIDATVVSQSADRAEVQVTLGSMEPVTYQFQKVGNIWLVPEVMNQMREGLDQQMANPNTAQMATQVVAGLSLFIPTLTKLDQAKTQEEFDELLAKSGLSQMLSMIPKPENTDALKGLPSLPGLPGGLPGLPAGKP
jgi:hypothetical protein